MERTVATASAVINFAEKLEDQSSSFYEELAKKFADDKEAFDSFAKESEKSKVLIVRTYRETITDAIEACYSFEGLNLDDYHVKPVVADTRAESLKTAIQLEDKAIKFYTDVAERSKSLLATIPMAFERVAKSRKNRKLKLESLLSGSTV
jgi:rubrerythrin